jgi:CubicO group peptidase (beta-lactamase class C family)
MDDIKGLADRYRIPGAAVGVLAGGREHFFCHGVTSVDNPLPVTPETLFLLGSVTKTYTATALLRLADPEDQVPSIPSVRVKNLLNHTSGLDWGLIADFGEGDDALARYAAATADLERIAPPGARASYSQAGYNLAGRLIEEITGQTYEGAIRSLLLEPLGLTQSFFDRDEIMTRRFSVGHNRAADGALSVARLWRRSRGDNPGGGLASSVADQLRWARFHLTSEMAMKEPTVALRGSNLGDAIGLGWFLRDLDGVRTAGHGGSANGQFCDLLLVPSHGFAVVSMANAAPDGIPFNRAVLRWALKEFTGLDDRDPEPLPFDPGAAGEVTGAYENDVMTLTVRPGGAAGLRLEVLMKPEIRAASDKELPPDHLPFDLGLLPADEYVLTSGAFQGQRGYFTRGTDGSVTGVDLAGRLFSRTAG